MHTALPDKGTDMHSASPTVAAELLTLWFGDLQAPSPAHQAAWFASSPDYDRMLSERFGRHIEQALGGQLDAWAETPRGALALVLLLDQLPRNVFRGDARAFAGDAAARRHARDAIDAAFDTQLPPFARVFLYMPFEHSESRADQVLSVALFTRLAGVEAAVVTPDASRRAGAESTSTLSSFLAHARAHADIVHNFGRFPHRNAILGRTSSAAELAFLARDGRRFGTQGDGDATK